MKVLIFLLLLLLFSTSNAQFYEVSCDVQGSDAYYWGVRAAYAVGSVLTGVVPGYAIPSPPGAGSAVGSAASALLRFLWPVITGHNDGCTSEALKQLSNEIGNDTKQKINDLTVLELRRWYQGHSNTATKINEWIPIIKGAKTEEMRHDASSEFLRELEFLYYSANEARYLFIENVENDATSFLFIRELAFLQFGISAEIIGNQYTPKVVKDKFTNDYLADVQFYWRKGHEIIENMLACMSRTQMKVTREKLTMHLLPLFDFSWKFLQKNASAIYSHQSVYKPVLSGSFAVFRLDNLKLASATDFFKHQFLTPETLEGAKLAMKHFCKGCNTWPLFNSSAKAQKCRGNVAQIHGKLLNEPLRTCDLVTVHFIDYVISTTAK